MLLMDSGTRQTLIPFDFLISFQSIEFLNCKVLWSDGRTPLVHAVDKVHERGISGCNTRALRNG